MMSGGPDPVLLTTSDWRIVPWSPTATNVPLPPVTPKRVGPENLLVQSKTSTDVAIPEATATNTPSRYVTAEQPPKVSDCCTNQLIPSGEAATAPKVSNEPKATNALSPNVMQLSEIFWPRE